MKYSQLLLKQMKQDVIFNGLLQYHEVKFSYRNTNAAVMDRLNLNSMI